MEIDLPHADMFQQRFMHYFRSKNCSVDVVKRMISKGADVNYKQWGLNTPMHIVLQHSSDKLNLVRALLFAGANVNACNAQKRSALHYAVLYADDVKILQVLIDQGAVLHMPDRFGTSPLHLAVQNDKKTFVEALIRSGAYINNINLYGETPLTIAVFNGNLEMVKLLLRSKASVLGTCRCPWKPCEGVNCLTRQSILIELMKYGANVFRFQEWLLCQQMSKFPKIPSCSLSCSRILVKCAILQGRQIKDIVRVNRRISIFLQMFKNFTDECMLEMQKMKLEFIHKNFSLFDFARDGFEDDPMFQTKTAYRERIIGRIIHVYRKYPLYADIIEYHLCKLDLCKTAMEFCVYTSNDCLEGKEQIFLTPDAVFLISQFLTNKEVLNFITAFLDPRDFATHDFELQNPALGKSVKRKLDMIC